MKLQLALIKKMLSLKPISLLLVILTSVTEVMSAFMGVYLTKLLVSLVINEVPFTSTIIAPTPNGVNSCARRIAPVLMFAFPLRCPRASKPGLSQDGILHQRSACLSARPRLLRSDQDQGGFPRIA